MALPVPRHLVEFALLGPTHDRRQLQDSPILGDVWLAFAAKPNEAIELLIEPHWQESAGTVAIALDDAITRPQKDLGADIAPLHGVVAARLYFDELLTVVVPKTTWWYKRSTHDRLLQLVHGSPSTVTPPVSAEASLQRIVDALLHLVAHWSKEFGRDGIGDTLPALDRYVALAGLIEWARTQRPPRKSSADPRATPAAVKAFKRPAAAKLVRALVKRLSTLMSSPAPTVTPPVKERPDLVWQVSLNRTASPALVASIPAVKGDAARRLFGVDCRNIAWAVIDSGIQGSHPAFRDANGTSRVIRSFDFTNIRKVVSLDNIREESLTRVRPGSKTSRLQELLHPSLADPPTVAEAKGLLKALADDARNKRPIHWELVRRFVEIRIDTPPRMSDHGTHVAGVIGADGKADGSADAADGMCPDIQLFDFRVLAPELRDTEFAIIAALQYIRFLNGRTDYMTIHGANLSLSIPHDVRNYACGRTPICVECERLVESGVVVVAAAGNLGYQSFQTSDGFYDGYAAFSVTDPGNAEGVITVGSTHRSAPHTYGVSFFSSRGPTGDGRAKPDLVAPGERIHAPYRTGWGDLDGTSMAAPHVSGAAAMLMARYVEMIGQPRRVKRILCESATDLGRERSFQGNGMVDVLRAFQSI